MKSLQEIKQPYNGITKTIIQQFYNGYDDKIIGQEIAKMKVLQALYPLMDNKQKKPMVILFYGDSGIGKTETAHYLAELLDGKLMRKQFSMYQNNQFGTYLFGGSYGEGSFAKDLLDRDSNVILLDEFDKANPVFHSAFYQLFDEGVYEDQNYKVNLDYAIIICTSNYKTESEIKEQLGTPIFNRFDAVIHFEDLSDEAKEKIARNFIRETIEKYKEDTIEMDENILLRLQKSAIGYSNAREIKHLIQKMLLKYAYNDMRSHKEDCSFFNEEIKQFLMNSDDTIPKENITILCGIAVNVSPVPDAMFGNLKLRWGKNPFFYSNSTIRNINYETGQIMLNENIEKENFPDLKISYVFRFNSVQFLLLCWDKESNKQVGISHCLLTLFLFRNFLQFKFCAY